MKNDLCANCDGSGEGMHEGTICTQCNGYGIIGHEPEGWV